MNGVRGLDMDETGKVMALQPVERERQDGEAMADIQRMCPPDLRNLL